MDIYKEMQIQAIQKLEQQLKKQVSVEGIILYFKPYK